jgi:protein TonB
MQGWIEGMLAWGVSGAIHVGALVVLYQNAPSLSPSSLVVQRGTSVVSVTYEPAEVAVMPPSRQVSAPQVFAKSRRVAHPRSADVPQSSSSVGGVFEGAQIAGSIVPYYPLSSRRRREEGTVVYRVSVSAQGISDSVMMIQSSGYSALDRAALSAISEARFSPATRDGKGVPSSKELSFVFQLQE